MAHTSKSKSKLVNRIKRIKGQVDAIERALEQESDCSSILQTVAACRGALNGLMSELIEGHVRFHVLGGGRKPSADQTKAADELIDVVKAYLK